MEGPALYASPLVALHFHYLLSVFFTNPLSLSLVPDNMDTIIIIITTVIMMLIAIVVKDNNNSSSSTILVMIMT